MTSSWYSVARWVSSQTTAAGTISGRVASPKCAASKVTQRAEPLAAGVDEVAGRVGDELVLGPHRLLQGALDRVQPARTDSSSAGSANGDAETRPMLMS